MEFDVEVQTIMQSLADRKASSRDPQLIKLVKRLLDPPPTEGTLTLSKQILDTPQSKEVDALFIQKVRLSIDIEITFKWLPAKKNGYSGRTYLCYSHFEFAQKVSF